MRQTRSLRSAETMCAARPTTKLEPGSTEGAQLAGESRRARRTYWRFLGALAAGKSRRGPMGRGLGGGSDRNEAAAVQVGGRSRTGHRAAGGADFKTFEPATGRCSFPLRARGARITGSLFFVQSHAMEGLAIMCVSLTIPSIL